MKKRFLRYTLELVGVDPKKVETSGIMEMVSKQIDSPDGLGRLQFGISGIGTAEDGSWLCEGKIICATKSGCDGVLAELKSELRNVFAPVGCKSIKSIYTVSGQQLW